METIIVGLMSGITMITTTIIQVVGASRKDKIDTKLSDLQISFDNKIAELKTNLEQEKLDRAKSDLVGLMSRVRNGYEPTTEEKMILYETKKKYNDLGGDSYVDDMFDKLKKEGKI